MPAELLRYMHGVPRSHGVGEVTGAKKGGERPAGKALHFATAKLDLSQRIEGRFTNPGPGR